MSPDILDRLRDADPVANMPETTPDDRERLLRAITTTPLDAKERPARRRPRHRIALFATVGGAVILLGGTGVYAAAHLLTPVAKGPMAPLSAEQQRVDYETWTHEIPLPPGAQWRAFRSPHDASTSHLPSHLDVVFEAMGHWTRAWIAATEAGDAPGAAAAEAWVDRLRATIPTITDEDTAKAYGTPYGTESLMGLDENGGAEYFNDAIAKAKAGHFDKLRRLVLGYTYWPTPEPTPKPSHFSFGFSSSGYGNVDDMNEYAITTRQAWAEYQAVLEAVGVPAGMDASGKTLDDPQDAFVHDALDKYGATTSALPEPVSPHDQLTDPRYQHDPGEGFEAAFQDLWALWWREWAAAAKAGDQERAAAAAAATARLQTLTPHKGIYSGHVITWTLEPEPQRDLEQLAAQARTGDLRGIEEWLAFQVWYAWSMLDAAGYTVE
jgi:hypothetical protein